MTPTPSPACCFQCGATEDDKPLLDLRMTGKPLHICPQCLPALIHHPDRVTEKLLEFLDGEARMADQK